MANAAPFNLPQAWLKAFETNQWIKQYLAENISAAAWHVEPAGGKGRTVAAIVAHMHNVLVMWMKAAAKESKISKQLDRNRVTPSQAARGLTQGYAALNAVIQSTLEGDGRVQGFKRDVGGFIGYLSTQDAHHRGQIPMPVRQAGHPLWQNAIFGMWEWGSRSKL
jgi:uncharacterized damage-inducible protein DinB